MTFREVTGGVCVPRGFLAAGVEAGIKRSGGPDLALLVSESEAAAAGVFTTNLAAAAPVQVCRKHLSGGAAKAVVINSGCANACTGKQGHLDAVQMTEKAGIATGASPDKVLVCSTGLIGSYLPMDKVAAGIEAACAMLGRDDELAARAIMTTDTTTKRASLACDEGWSIGGMAKGAGMIAPNMATMLAFVTTDAAIAARQLQPLLAEAVEATFNRITIDGDTSTNDAVIALANGASGVSPDPAAFKHAMHSVCRSLAEKIVADGEGSEKFVRVQVAGAADEAEAILAARCVAQSILVKTAVHGGDANWGRIAAALGRSGAHFQLEGLSIEIGGVSLLAGGEPPLDSAVAAARAKMTAQDITIKCTLGAGGAEAEVLTTDLGPAYVAVNATYET